MVEGFNPKHYTENLNNLLEKAKKVIEGKNVWILDKSQVSDFFLKIGQRLEAQEVKIFTSYRELGDNFLDQCDSPQPASLPDLIIVDIAELYDEETQTPINPEGFVNIFQVFSRVATTKVPVPKIIFTGNGPINPENQEQIKKIQAAYLDKTDIVKFGVGKLLDTIVKVMPPTQDPLAFPPNPVV